MKIHQHPRMHDIQIGDEVYCSQYRLVARVEDVFPAAVCVKIATLILHQHFELFLTPELWRAEDITNLSVCSYCGSRERLNVIGDSGIPYRACATCVPLTSDISTPPDGFSTQGPPLS